MRSELEADGTLVVRHDSTSWLRFFLAASVALLAIAGYDLLRVSPPRHDRLGATLISAALCLGCGLAMAESGRFAFDRARRLVVWRKRWAWVVREGSLSFDDVRGVVVQTPLGDEGVPSRRITLKLADGRELPLRTSYRPDATDEVPRLAEQIRVVLGHPAAPEAAAAPPPAALDALLHAGRTIEAIKLLRREKGISLRDAKLEVDEALARMR